MSNPDQAFQDAVDTKGSTANPVTNEEGVGVVEQRFADEILPHLPVLYRTARAITRSSTDAEDLVQDTLLRAYRALERFDGRYPKAWLLTILRNTNINRARKKTPDLLDDPDFIFERSERFADNEGPEQIVVEPVFHSIVAAAFNDLPESFRQVIELVDLNGLPYADAAELLDVPVGTVMSRLHRGRRRIREQIGAAGMDRTTRGFQDDGRGFENDGKVRE